MENHRRIDQALKQQAVVDGCPLSPAGPKDYKLLPMMLSKYGFPCVFHKLDVVGNGGVSIDQMYKNLAHLAAGGKHWMFDDIFINRPLT